MSFLQKYMYEQFPTKINEKNPHFIMKSNLFNRNVSNILKQDKYNNDSVT